MGFKRTMFKIKVQRKITKQEQSEHGPPKKKTEVGSGAMEK